MESARMTKEGVLLDSEGREPFDVLPLLGAALLLAPDCSLRSFFDLLRRYPLLRKLSPFLDPALAEADACPDAGCLSDDIACLVIGKTLELTGFPGEARMEQFVWLRALPDPGGPRPAGTGALPSGTAALTADRETRFTPLSLLLDMPLVLGGLRHVVLGETRKSLLCESRFTLFEVVDGLAWDFGFRGGSQQCSIGR